MTDVIIGLATTPELAHEAHEFTASRLCDRYGNRPPPSKTLLYASVDGNVCGAISVDGITAEDDDSLPVLKTFNCGDNVVPSISIQIGKWSATKQGLSAVLGFSALGYASTLGKHDVWMVVKPPVIRRLKLMGVPFERVGCKLAIDRIPVEEYPYYLGYPAPEVLMLQIADGITALRAVAEEDARSNNYRFIFVPPLPRW